MRHQVINAQLLRQARAAIDAEAHARLARGARRRRRSQVVRGWWQLARWPQVAADHPVSRPQASS